jgi:hypothetical protein
MEVTTARVIVTHDTDVRVPEGWTLKRVPDKDFGMAWWAVGPRPSDGFGPYVTRGGALGEAVAQHAKRPA